MLTIKIWARDLSVEAWKDLVTDLVRRDFRVQQDEQGAVLTVTTFEYSDPNGEGADMLIEELQEFCTVIDIEGLGRVTRKVKEPPQVV